jgi:hypothetical protein
MWEKKLEHSPIPYKEVPFDSRPHESFMSLTCMNSPLSVSRCISFTNGAYFTFTIGSSQVKNSFETPPERELSCAAPSRFRPQAESGDIFSPPGRVTVKWELPLRGRTVIDG